MSLVLYTLLGVHVFPPSSLLECWVGLPRPRHITTLNGNGVGVPGFCWGVSKGPIETPASNILFMGRCTNQLGYPSKLLYCNRLAYHTQNVGMPKAGDG